jgi:hypothetical protein
MVRVCDFFFSVIKELTFFFFLGTPINLSSHKELRPVTHPILDEEIIYRRDTRKKKSFADNFHKNNYQVTNNYKETMDFRLIG